MSDYTALERRLIEEVDIMTRKLAVITTERDDLQRKLNTAVSYLKTGKAKFSPHTTNSLVDEFIDDFDDSKGGDK